MYEQYAHVLIFSLVAAACVLTPIIVFALIRPSRPEEDKLSAYECGERPVGSPWIQFNIRYYIICLIFIIFEVEVLLVFPWAVVYKSFIAGPEAVQALAPSVAANAADTSGWFVFGAMFVFFVMLAVGLAYDWGKGYLEWQREMTGINRAVSEALEARAKKEEAA
jgi:NADH-quinone oxidoreductase subunit A